MKAPWMRQRFNSGRHFLWPDSNNYLQLWRVYASIVCTAYWTRGYFSKTERRKKKSCRSGVSLVALGCSGGPVWLRMQNGSYKLWRTRRTFLFSCSVCKPFAVSKSEPLTAPQTVSRNLNYSCYAYTRLEFISFCCACPIIYSCILSVRTFN